MKKSIIVVLLLLLFNLGNAMSKENNISDKNINDLKNKINLQPIVLKYSKVTEDLKEVYEYIGFYKAILDTMNTWNLNFKETKKKLKKYIDNMSKQKKCRFGYLDWKISNIYPEFYSEFFLINNHPLDAIRKGLYTKKELNKYSIFYNRMYNLPSILYIEMTFWKSLLKINNDLELFYNIIPFRGWYVIKFEKIEKKIKFKHHYASPAIKAKAVIVDSPFSKVIDKKIELLILMFGSKESYSYDKKYLINCRYYYYNKPKNENYVSFIGFITQVNRINELEDDKIIFKHHNSINLIDYKDFLEDTHYNSKSQLFLKIKELIKFLKRGGVK